MIRIKDYIFNENDIKVIENDEDLLTIILKDGSYRETRGTLEDIEWNYGNNISESLSYDLAKAKIEELEEEKNRIKSDYTSVKISCNVLENRINKAIEYIEETKCVFGTNLDMHYLLKILKGEE